MGTCVPTRVHPDDLRQAARRLREIDGLGYGEIARQLEVSTSRRWTMDIQLSGQQLANLEKRRTTCALRRSKTMSGNYRDRRNEWQLEGRARASEGEPLHMAGCLLYWAEGTKARNVVALTNSDANLLRFFLRFLRECFGVAEDDLALHLNFYTGNGLSIAEIEAHWLEQLALPADCFRKHVIDHRTPTTTGLKTGKLPYGTANLRVLRSTAIVQHIYGAIQEYAGFDEPRWLG